jgi:hypothetical protein
MFATKSVLERSSLSTPRSSRPGKPRVTAPTGVETDEDNQVEE